MCNKSCVGSRVREGTPGHHEPLPCRHEPSIFDRQTEPPLCRKKIFFNMVAQEFYLRLMLFIECEPSNFFTLLGDFLSLNYDFLI